MALSDRDQSLDLLKSAPRQRETINSANEPPWLQPYPDSGESSDTADFVAEIETIGLAFIAALQNLPGRQRAALILRDVLGFTAAETAGILACSTPAANSALQRARSTMAATHPVSTTMTTTEEQQAVAERFLKAWRAADTDALVSLLHETVHMTMPPHRLEVFGRLNTVEFLLDVSPDRDPDKLRFRAIAANGQRGLAMYVHDDSHGHHVRHCLMLFQPNEQGIDKITGFTEDRVFDLLDLPTTIQT